MRRAVLLFFAWWLVLLQTTEVRIQSVHFLESNASQFIAGPQETVLVVSPHLDDAMFSMGGYLYRSRAQKWLVNIFAGAPVHKMTTYWDKKLGYKDSDKTLSIRGFEDRKAWRGWNVTAINFDFLDQVYAPDNTEQLVRMREQLTMMISTLKARGRLLTVFGPAAHMNATSHTDHIKVHNVLRTVAQEQQVKLLFYMDYPYAKWYVERYGQQPSQYFAQHYRQPVHESVLRLRQEDLAAKLERSWMYRSQVKAVHTFLWDQVAIDLLCGGKPCERFWQLMPPTSAI